jgi:hypothetical protein
MCPLNTEREVVSVLSGTVSGDAVEEAAGSRIRGSFDRGDLEEAADGWTAVWSYKRV